MTASDRDGRPGGLREAVERLASRLLKFDALNEQIPAHVDVPDDYEAGVNEAGRYLRALLAEHPATPAEEECACPYTDPSTWLSAASCGYGSGYEPGSMQEWNPDCPVHPATTAIEGHYDWCSGGCGGSCQRSIDNLTPEPAEVAVEDALRRAFWSPDNRGQWPLIAAALLASDWLREHDAALTAKAKVEALRAAADQLDHDGMKRLSARLVKQWLRMRAERGTP